MMSIRLRLAFLFTAVFLALIAVFATTVYFTLSYYLYNNVDSSLAGSGQVIADRLSTPSRSASPSLARALGTGPTTQANLYDSQGG